MNMFVSITSIIILGIVIYVVLSELRFNYIVPVSHRSVLSDNIQIAVHKHALDHSEGPLTSSMQQNMPGLSGATCQNKQQMSSTKLLTTVSFFWQSPEISSVSVEIEQSVNLVTGDRRFLMSMFLYLTTKIVSIQAIFIDQYQIQRRQRYVIYLCTLLFKYETKSTHMSAHNCVVNFMQQKRQKLFLQFGAI